MVTAEHASYRPDTEYSGIAARAVESCHIKVKDSELTAHIWRFLYDVVRQYRESFDVYGTKKSFEWTLVENEPHVIHIAQHLSFVQGGGHGGSHPHLVDGFVTALLEDRDPWPNAVTSANWTCVGICAHESATQGGAIVRLPEFTRR